MPDNNDPSTVELTHTQAAESGAICASVSEVEPFGFEGPLRCLLTAPHLGYRHYAALPFKPDRFWTWDDKHPEHPCSSVDCPGDGRYMPPGKGHYGGCGHLNRLSPVKSSGQPIDLLAALQRSVDAAKTAREERS